MAGMFRWMGIVRAASMVALAAAATACGEGATDEELAAWAEEEAAWEKDLGEHEEALTLEQDWTYDEPIVRRYTGDYDVVNGQIIRIPGDVIGSCTGGSAQQLACYQRFCTSQLAGTATVDPVSGPSCVSN